MTGFGTRELKGLAWIGGIFTVLGLLLMLTTRPTDVTDGFWECYRIGLRGTGMMLLIFGPAWLALSWVLLKTRFFDPSRKMDADKFAISMVVIVAAVIVLLLLVLPKVPSTDAAQLPTDPEKREAVLRPERNFKTLVASGILLTGVALASIPCRRFLRA